MTVDFVYKQRADNDKKWALRNAKLRMSRKLIFAAGLVHVFFCHLDAAAELARTALIKAKDVSLLTTYLLNELANPPLETIAKACLELSVREDTSRAIFDSYNQFLAILDDPQKRGELEMARTHDDLRTSAVWKEVRDLSRLFHEGLVNLFLQDDDRLKQLAMTYGVF